MSKTELAKGANCGCEFKRRAGRSNPRKFCDKPRCQKVSKIKNTVCTFAGISNHVSEYRADLDYHGRPYL